MSLFGPPDVKQLKEKGNVKGLIKALNYKTDSIREESAKALGELRDQRAVDPLLAAINDNSGNVSCAVIEALGAIGDPQALREVLSMIKSKNISIALSAARAAAKIDPVKTLDAIATPSIGHWDNYVKSSLTELVNRIFSQNLQPLLEAINQGDCDSRISAMENAYTTLLPLFMFREYYSRYYPKYFIVAARDENAKIRLHALIALLHLHDHFSTYSNIFEEALKDEDAAVRKQAVYSLGRTMNSQNKLRYISLIREALKDDNEAVREEAKKTLAPKS